MAKLSSLTIIDDKNVRGVLAPRSVLSKKLLEDIIDVIEWSTPESIKETERMVAEANRDNSWIPAEEAERRLKIRLKKSK